MAQWTDDPTGLCGGLLDAQPGHHGLGIWHRPQVGLRLDPWPGNLHMPQAGSETNKQKLNKY